MNKHTPIEGIVEEFFNRFFTDLSYKVQKEQADWLRQALQSQADKYEKDKGEAVKEAFSHFSWCQECADGPICSEAKAIAQKYGVDLSE